MSSLYKYTNPPQTKNKLNLFPTHHGYNLVFSPPPNPLSLKYRGSSFGSPDLSLCRTLSIALISACARDSPVPLNGYLSSCGNVRPSSCVINALLHSLWMVSKGCMAHRNELTVLPFTSSNCLSTALLVMHRSVMVLATFSRVTFTALILSHQTPCLMHLSFSQCSWHSNRISDVITQPGRQHGEPVRG